MSGRREQEASFFTVVVWRDQVEHASESLSKGSRVVVVGRLQQRSWSAEDGSTRSVVEVVAEELGPSLRWATARPERASRSTGTQVSPCGGSCVVRRCLWEGSYRHRGRPGSTRRRGPWPLGGALRETFLAGTASGCVCEQPAGSHHGRRRPGVPRVLRQPVRQAVLAWPAAERRPG
ncbi:MAG TPA: single-stranded DNA-binding protein [Actinomycetes bacterium]|nr:single-stranded DNA-binding protein [Actinomycetes bacterium]